MPTFPSFVIVPGLISLLMNGAACAADQTAPPATPPASTADDGRAVFLRLLAAAPAVQAAQERRHAADHAAGAAGRLPDPMLGAGYARKSTSADRWPMYDVSLEQPLPRWGERTAQRTRAAAEQAMGAADLHEVTGDVAAEVATLLADAEAARATLALLDEQIARATVLRNSIAVRVASGTGRPADLLGIDSRLAALAVERDTTQRLVADAAQDARARLGLAADAALPPFVAPDRTRLVLDQVPGVLNAQARSAEAEAMFGEARASRYPETAVGVRYEREVQPGDPMNTVGLEVRVSLPVWQGASANLEDAAAARRRAAQRDAEQWQQRAQAALGRAERAAAVAERARASAQGTSARLTAEYDAMIRTTATPSGGELIAVFDILDRLSDARRQVIDAEAAAHQAEASLWRLAPPDLPTLSSERNQP
jgi:outer membrane protein TolC